MAKVSGICLAVRDLIGRGIQASFGLVCMDFPDANCSCTFCVEYRLHAAWAFCELVAPQSTRVDGISPAPPFNATIAMVPIIPSGEKDAEE